MSHKGFPKTHMETHKSPHRPHPNHPDEKTMGHGMGKITTNKIGGRRLQEEAAGNTGKCYPLKRRTRIIPNKSHKGMDNIRPQANPCAVLKRPFSDCFSRHLAMRCL